MRNLAKSNGVIPLQCLQLTELSLTDRDLYFNYMKISEYPIDVFSWYFPYLWSSSQSSVRRFYRAMIDDMLVTFVHSRRNNLYLWCLPFGPGGREKVISVLYKSLKYCAEWNENSDIKPLVKTINSPQLDYLQQYPNFRKHFYSVNLMGIERMHSINNLLSLPGSSFKNIRKKLHKFAKNHPGAFTRKYEQRDYNALLELQDYWNNTAGEKYKRIFDLVKYRETIKHCVELNHLILVMEYQSKIIGMISGSLVPSGQAFSYFIKTRDTDGLSEVLLVELTREIHRQNPHVELLNVGSDLGPGGLRSFKEKFRPVKNHKRYALYLK